MEASHKTHRPHIKVGKDEEKKTILHYIHLDDLEFETDLNLSNDFGLTCH